VITPKRYSEWMTRRNGSCDLVCLVCCITFVGVYRPGGTDNGGSSLQGYGKPMCMPRGTRRADEAQGWHSR
jgi:hypothetical protein